MRRKRSSLLPIGLLTVATIAIGGIVYGLLWREARRIQQIADNAAREQAMTVADNIGLVMTEAKTALIEGLNSFRGPYFGPQLDAWQKQEPLARFTFVWDSATPKTVSIFPSEIESADVIESANRIWSQNPAAQAETAKPELAKSDAKQAEESSAYGNFSYNVNTRQEIRQRSKVSSAMAQKTANIAPLPWTSEPSRWQLEDIEGEDVWVGYVAWNGGERITGVALDLPQLYEAFRSSLPNQSTTGVSGFSILTPQGVDILANGREPTKFASLKSSFSYDIAIDLGPELPNWKLAIRTDNLDTMTNALLSPGGIAAAALLTVLFASGLWLAWQSSSSQKDAAKKVTFVSNVSHELKTPLTTIRMYSEMLQSDRIVDESKRNSYLGTIASESQRLTRMVNNVLDFSRLERGKGSVTPVSQRLSEFLVPYLEQRREEIERAGFTFVTHIEDSGHDCLFDIDALTQILGNLIDNSLKYARNGAWLAIRTHEEKDAVTISVSDRGDGLPRSLRRKRFRPFERGDTSLVAEASGFGLGLSIAQSLAKEMGAGLRYYHPRNRSENPSFVITLATRD